MLSKFSMAPDTYIQSALSLGENHELLAIANKREVLSNLEIFLLNKAFLKLGNRLSIHLRSLVN